MRRQARVWAGDGGTTGASKHLLRGTRSAHAGIHAAPGDASLEQAGNCEEPGRQTGSAPSVTHRDLDGVHVLVVEDTDDSREVLRAEGFGVPIPRVWSRDLRLRDVVEDIRDPWRLPSLLPLGGERRGPPWPPWL